MPAEGMVHALHRAHRLLSADGCLIDLHPAHEPAAIEVGGVFVGRLDGEKAQRRHAAADAAIAAAAAGGMFAAECAREISFRTHGDSIEELRDYVGATWNDSRVGDALVDRARGALRANPAATLWITERLRLTSLRPR
jgi:hypothetical protein